MRMVHIAKKIIYDNEPSVMSQSDIRDIEHQIANRLLSENYEYKNYLTIETAKDELQKICESNKIDNDDLNNNKNSNPDLPNEKFQLLVSARTYIENKEKELEAML